MLLADQGSHTARVREATGTEEALPQDNLNSGLLIGLQLRTSYKCISQDLDGDINVGHSYLT